MAWRSAERGGRAVGRGRLPDHGRSDTRHRGGRAAQGQLAGPFAPGRPTGCVGDPLAVASSAGASGPDRSGAAPAIRRPPIAHQHPGEVGPEDRRRIVETATGANRIDRRCRRGECPQPVADGTNAPAGLVRGDYGAVPYLPAQRRVGRRGLTSGAVQHAGEAPGVTVIPNCVRSRCASFSSGTPNCVCICTTSATAAGPSCTLAAPSASEVCSRWRP